MSIVFDQAVDYYDQTRGLPEQIQHWLAAAVEDQIGVPRGARLLEIGVGTGRIALPLARRGYRYVGTDLSLPMMHTLRAKAATTPITLVQGNIAQLPFGDQIFDAVVAVHIFHLVDAWSDAMNEAARVLRRGGLLLHGTSKRDDDGEPSLRQRMHDRANELQPRHDNRLRWDDINEQLADRFGTPQPSTSPPWTTTHTPRGIIDQFRNRIWSATWHLRDDVLAEVVDAATVWAQERYGDMDAPFPVSQRFVWQVYRT